MSDRNYQTEFGLIGLYCNQCDEIYIIKQTDTWTHSNHKHSIYGECPYCRIITDRCNEIELPDRGYRLGVYPPGEVETESESHSIVGSRVYPTLGAVRHAAKKTSSHYPVEILVVLNHRFN